VEASRGTSHESMWGMWHHSVITIVPSLSRHAYNNLRSVMSIRESEPPTRSRAPWGDSRLQDVPACLYLPPRSSKRHDADPTDTCARPTADERCCPPVVVMHHAGPRYPRTKVSVGFMQTP